MNLDFNNLTKLHKEILKKTILWQHQHKHGLLCETIYKYFFYEDYTEEEICNALDKLVKLGFITKRGGPRNFTYELIDNQYLAAKKHFKWYIWCQNFKERVKNYFIWLWKHFIITIITSAITAYITVKISQLACHTTTPQSHTNSTSQPPVDQKRKRTSMISMSRGKTEFSLHPPSKPSWWRF